MPRGPRSKKINVSQDPIRAKLNILLEENNEDRIKELISRFFLQDVSFYINEVTALNNSLLGQEGHPKELEKRFVFLTDEILLKGYELEKALSDKKIMEKVKDSFRQLVGAWVYTGAIVKRAFEKPRGYPGDYEMLEIVYNNKPVSEGIGWYCDKYFLQNPYAVAVRIRKDRLRELVEDYINVAGLNSINILNIACGSCREIRELITGVSSPKPVTFTCLDWDKEALSFSEAELLKQAAKDIKFNFVKEDVMRIVKDNTCLQSYGEPNLIYSIGLIDYLPDRILKRLIRSLYSLLQDGGSMILTHKNRERTFPPLAPDWFCDWKFVPRNKEEITHLFYDCGIPRTRLTCESDDFEYIYYFTIIKN